jgi:hypothetical protein
MRNRSTVRQTRFLMLAVCCLAALLASCRGKPSDAPLTMEDLGQVSGQVTYNGVPVKHGALFFFSPKALICVAPIEGDGSYKARIMPGDFTVGVVTTIEPKDAYRFANEGPPGTPKGDLSKGGAAMPQDGGQGPGAPGGPPKAGGPDGKGPKLDPYDRYPSLASVKEKMTAEDRNNLDAVQRKYGEAAQSGLTITIHRGTQTKDFRLN